MNAQNIEPNLNIFSFSNEGDKQGENSKIDFHLKSQKIENPNLTEEQAFADGSAFEFTSVKSPGKKNN